MKKSTNPIWGGRFKNSNSELLKKINNSISFDYELAFQDVKLNKVYSEALFRAKVITKNQKDKIIKALNEINQELMNEKFKFSDSYEDIHMNIEMALKSKVGEIAGKIHTGKSRNDQVATDLKMWIREKLDEIIKRIKQIQKTIIRKSEENMNVIMPGFTHLQNAQPILFSHYLMSFFEMINRDKTRSLQLIESLNECPLGSGALAGTNFFEIDRFFIAKQLGFSDQQIAKSTNSDFFEVRKHRKDLEVIPIYKTVDTCSAEFSSSTPYHYSTYEESFFNFNSQIFDNEISENSKSKKIMILGGGPNRIGQGIEFDYCCCHASYQASTNGYKTIMVNSNPETVSTDYDTSDILYFEPVTLEDVLNIIEAENPYGLIVQFGGQTPLKLSLPLFEWLKSNDGIRTGSKILGTSPTSIDLAEDREEFTKILDELSIRQPLNGIARNQNEAEIVAKNIGFPLVVRPSYVLGGRAMEIVKDENELSRYISEAVKVSPDHPILLDQYLNNAIEIDVDALCDSEGSVVIAGLMEHVEPAGIHSGDSACCLPSISLSKSIIENVRNWTKLIAQRLNVVGLINLQFAVVNTKNNESKLFILEANPRASRTIPFVSKAIGIPVAKLATQLMQGFTLEDVNFTEEFSPKFQAVKEAVLPFKRFPGSDALLGPEMRSTGEVMGLAKDFGIAYAKSELAAGNGVPSEGVAFLSTNDLDKKNLEEIAKELLILGFKLIATKGTASYLVDLGIQVEEVLKVHEGRPNIEDLIRSGLVQLIINTPIGSQALHDDAYLRRAALEYNIPTFTTIPGANAAIKAIKALQSKKIDTYSLQEIHNY